MKYHAVLTLDYVTQGGQVPFSRNEYQRLLNALCQAGWKYAETSALYVDCEDLGPIRLALELLAKAADSPGAISAMTLTVQLVGEDRDPPAAANHRRAYDNIVARRLPSDPV